MNTHTVFGDNGSTTGERLGGPDRFEAHLESRLESERLITLLEIASLMATDLFGAGRDRAVPMDQTRPSSIKEPLGARSHDDRGV